MRKVYQVLFLLTFLLMIFLPLTLQVSSNMIQLSRLMNGVPLILIFTCAALTLSTNPLSNAQNVLLAILGIVFFIEFFRGFVHPDTNLTGVLAYTRSFWIYFLFYLFGYGCNILNLVDKIKLYMLIYFALSFAFLLFEFFGGAEAAIFLGYNNFKEQSALAFELSHLKPFFNLSLFSEYLTYRPEGPTGSTISYAYSLLVLPFIFKPYTKYFYSSFLIMFMILLILGSKGALILFMMLFLIFIYFKYFKDLKSVIIVCSLVAVGISATQILTGDNHGLGLVGGMANILEYPFGRGIGVGGNLAGSYFNSEDGGRSFLYGSESMFGVFFTQIGIFFAAHLLFIFNLMKRHIKTPYTNSLISICYLVTVFGLSQEEAWSTLAALPFMLLGVQAHRGNNMRKVAYDKALII